MSAPVIHSVERGDGTPILILHGGGLDHHHMLDAIEPVFDMRKGFRRIYIDLPGHGRSDGSVIETQDDVLSAVNAYCEETFADPSPSSEKAGEASSHAAFSQYRRSAWPARV